MKKILTLLLILALSVSVFAGCAKIKEVLPDSIKDKFPALRDDDTTNDDANQPSEDDGNNNQQNPPVENPPVEEDPAEAALKAAYDYVHQLYKDIAEKTPANYNLVTSVKVEEATFAVTWEVSSDELSIVPGEKENVVTVVVPEPVADISYTLKFTVTDAEGNTLSREYNHIVPKFKFTTFAEYAAAEVDEPVTVAGLVSGVVSKTTGSQTNGLYIQDLNNEGGYYVYNLTDDVYETVKPGMTVKVKGVKALYNGTYEVVDASVEVVDSEIKAVVPVDYTDLVANAAGLDAAELVEKQGMLVTIKGVTILEAGDNGYYYFQAAGHKVYLRISSSNNPTSKEALETIKAVHAANYGNTADVTGLITLYSGKFYLSPVSADAFSNIQTVQKSDAEKVAAELDLIKLVDQLAVSGTVALPVAGSSYSDVTIAWASDNAAAVVNGGSLVVTMPEADATVTLTATVSCGDVTETKTFTLKLVVTETSISDALEIGGSRDHNDYTADKYIVTGEITSVDNATYGNLKIKDADGNVIVLYGTYSADGSLRYDKLAVKPVVGDTITVFGILGNYNGTVQLKNSWIINHVPGEGGEVDPPVADPTPDTEISIEDAIALGASKEHDTYTEGKYYVTGEITEISNTKYGNLKIKDANGNILTVYGTWNEDGTVRFDALETKPEVGDTVTVYGIIGQYNGTPQVKNGWFKSAPVVCEHTNTTTTTVDATCTTDGSETVVCDDCGETLSTKVLPAAHNYVDGACSVCGFCENHTIEQNIFYHPEMVSATCTEEGVAVFECTVCDYYYTEATPINPEAHDWDWNNPQVITPADCATMTNGVNLYTCTACGATEEKESYASHDLVETVVQATCTEDGSYYAVCSVCGYEESNVIEAEGHYNWYLTCNETGECMACGEEFTKPDHEGNPATCTEAMYCFNCWSYVGEPLGHNYVDGVCTNCGESESGSVTAVTPGTYLGTDDYGNQLLTVVVDETTVTFTYNHPMMGSTTVVANYYIENGEVVLIDPATETVLNPLSGALYIDANGLPTSAAYNGNNYTLLAEGAETPVDPVYPELVLGENTLTINDTWNGDTYTFTAAEDGTYNFIVGTNGMLVVESSNVSDVYFEGDTYSVECVAGDVLTLIIPVSDSNSNVAVITVEFVAPVCEHTNTTTTTVDATCTTDGSVTVTCDDCKEVVSTETINATGHSHEAVVTAPTCTEAGYTTYTCACGDSYTENGAAALGHTEGAAATCTTAQTCTVCGATLVAALGHSYGDDGFCTVCGAKNPDHAFELSLADAVLEADGQKVIVSGNVISADSWSTQYSNMSVTIKDENGDTLYIFRLGTQVGLGDYITVTGAMGTYNGNRQIAQGATAVIVTVHGDNHTYADGVCTVCGTQEPVAGETIVKCDFSTLAQGTQYADETNTFDAITVSTKNQGCHFNTQLRIYDSTSNNGWAVVEASGNVMNSIVINAGYKAATLNVYGSTDGENWVLIEAVTTTTSYADHTVDFDTSLGYTYLKLDASGAQIRIASITVTYVG